MTKRLIFTAALLTAVIMAAYLVWTAQSSLVATRPAANSSAGPSRVDAPAQLGALKLVETKTGPDALSEFTQLHGKGFDLTGGYMAQYQAGSAHATLWVAQARDAAGAQRMVDDMAKKIGPDNKVFADLQPLTISGRTLYMAEGMGQQHFFYARNNEIVWLAADPEQAAEALHALWGKAP